MSTRGRRILIGVAVVLSILFFLGKGCLWLVVHTPEPQVIKIKHDAMSDLAMQANGLAQNRYSEDLVFDYHQVGNKIGTRVKNMATLSLSVGERLEGMPWKRGYIYGRDEICIDPPTFLQLTAVEDQSSPVLDFCWGKKRLVQFWGEHPGIASLVFIVTDDRRVEKDPLSEVHRCGYYQRYRHARSGWCPTLNARTQAHRLAFIGSRLFYNKISIEPRRGHKALKALLI